MTDEEVVNGIATIFAMIAAVFILLGVHSCTKSATRQQAVNAGAAKWTVDNKGVRNFEYISKTEGEQDD